MSPKRRGASSSERSPAKSVHGSGQQPGPRVPMHPESAPDPAVVRWVVPFGTLAFTGPVGSVPGPLGERLAAGQASVILDATGVIVRLEPPLTWPSDGAAIRTELSSALTRPEEWTPQRETDVMSAGEELDARLRERVLAAIEGEAGDYVRSHGGEVRLVDVQDGEVLLDLQGACRGCPASAFTLQRRFETDLRRLAPGVVRVRATA